MRTEEATKPSLYIATPAYGGMVSVPYVQSLAQLTHALGAAGVASGVDMIGNQSLVPLARNKLAAGFLASSCTHLLFIDADIGFPAELVPRMLAADVDVIGALYPMKRVRWDRVATAAENGERGVPASLLRHASRDFVVRTPPGGVELRDSVDAPPVEVLAVGTGLMLIKRGAFEAMRPSTATFHLDGEQLDEFFVSGCVERPEGKFEHLPEDFYFCEAFRSIGGKIHAVCDSRVVHFGTYAY